MERPLISIIIPTLNEEKQLPYLLNNISSQTYSNKEVIVADANSSDKTRSIATSFGAKIVTGGKPGIARNNGAKHAKGTILAFIDADSTFQNDFLDKAIRDLTIRKADCSVPIYNNKDVRPLKYKLNFIFWNVGLHLWQYTFAPTGSTQVLFIKKSVFNALGGFNPQIEISEDIDLIKRTVREDYRYRIINKTAFYPSVRRFDKNGFYKTVAAGLYGYYLVYRNRAEDKKAQKNLLKRYGGWVNW